MALPKRLRALAEEILVDLHDMLVDVLPELEQRLKGTGRQSTISAAIKSKERADGTFDIEVTGRFSAPYKSKRVIRARFERGQLSLFAEEPEEHVGNGSRGDGRSGSGQVDEGAGAAPEP